LESWIEKRRAIAKRYDGALADLGLQLPYQPPGVRHVYHQYTIRVPDRDRVHKELRDAGVQTMIYYPVPLHLQKVHATLGKRVGAFPESERAALEVLSIPMYPELEPDVQDRVICAIRSCHGEASNHPEASRGMESIA
jgi:dTDP-4-amino-4,6-dideoxygalactose transaminase